MYQAAVSRTEVPGSSSEVIEEGEACSLPGGLSSVKSHFESQEFSSSQSTVTQFHFKQKSVQDVTSSSVLIGRGSSKELSPLSQRGALSRDEKISHHRTVHHDNTTSSYENHFDEMVGEDSAKVSTQALKEQFEKTIEESTPKQMKINLSHSQAHWDPGLSTVSQASSEWRSESTSKTIRAQGMASASESAYGSSELFPTPPDLMPEPKEVPDSCPSPELPEQTCSPKYVPNREQYSKQRNLYELKRLYKHIHPEVRRNLERDIFSEDQLESGEEELGDVLQARYMFENTGNSPNKSMSPEREYLEWDEILKGEVQSMRWMFENKPLDSIKDESPDEYDTKNIAQQEIIAGNDVRYTTWMFETQPIDTLGTETPDSITQVKGFPELARGDVQTATWLFETQPLDSLNKIHQEEEDTQEVIRTQDITGGDVKTARYLFETQHLDSLGHTETIDESHFLSLKSELEEIKGDVKTTTKMFETQPMCVIRGDSGEMLEIMTIRREETEKGDVKTSRWLFETQPLDLINKDPSEVKVVCGVSMEDNYKGGVNMGRWLFETKTLDTINYEEWQSSKLEKEEILGADVKKYCWAFETQPMDTLRDNANDRPVPTEDILGGDVRTARYLFETVPMDALKDSPEVGKLKKVVTSEEEKGDVRHQRWVFESQPLDNIREEKKEFTRTVDLQKCDKGDVTNYKEIFETMDLSRCDATQKIQVEGFTSGAVKSNKDLFETTPMYAMQDRSGHYHEVKTVRREEIVEGDVRRCKWMFETKPIDQFDESLNKFQIIKGISKQEIQSGDVKTAKWLFETQPLDSIKYFSNVDDEDEKSVIEDGLNIVKGDVKTCRWLFETQQMDELYEKEEVNKTESEEIHKGDVKTCTWLFETQALDTLKDESEMVLRPCTVRQEDVQGKDVRSACFLFETENLENITGEEGGSFKRVTEIDIQSGDVSRMKYIFENQSSDIVTSTSEEIMRMLKASQTEDIQKGNVVNCTWLFENQPIDTICESSEEPKQIRTVTDVQGGNVAKGCFIFETTSLDKIQEDSSETQIERVLKVTRDDMERGDVKNYTMLFETQPLYAIQDKEGHYHEVTTVTKEETMRGDVVGARWLFETKPLDSIKDSEVYVIKSVTEEDIQKGDVTSARWRFETQPLDEIAEDEKVFIKTVEDIQGGDVQSNKRRFETDEQPRKCVRTVSVSEIQKGDVRTSTWMFETRAIDSIHGEDSEYDQMETVTKEEVLKGDVKQSVWLFEKQPLDHINESEATVTSREEIPQADVKTTTWLFETTPFHEFNEHSVEKTEIVGKSVKETLEELYSQKMVESQGILIEADEIGDVRMAKYKLLNQEAPEIQREEVIRGDLKNIMINLLNRQDTTEKGIIIDQGERGDINSTVKQLFNQEVEEHLQKEEIIRGDIQEALSNLLKEEGSTKRGILIQEDEKGDVRMTIYSLLNKKEQNGIQKEDVISGNVKRTLSRLLSSPDSADSSVKIKVSDTERGNVSFYSTCIESGALDYLKKLQREPEEALPDNTAKEEIVGGDIAGTKLILRRNQTQIERTVAEDDIVPGNVHNTIKVFMTEPAVSLSSLQREDIVSGDLRATLSSLTQAINQTVNIEKEEVVKGDISTALKSLMDAQNQFKEIEKPDIVPGDIRGALESLEKSSTTKTEMLVDDLVPGDIKSTLKSLEMAKKVVKGMEKEEIVKGDVKTAIQCLREAANEKKVYQQEEAVQGDVQGAIQQLLEQPASTKMQRRPSMEGDVKNSIKALYCMQDQTSFEKEEIVKGDVKGTIKSLLQDTQQNKVKSRIDHTKKVKVPVKTPLHSQQEFHECSVLTTAEGEMENPIPAVQNVSQTAESLSSEQKHTSIKLAKSKSLTQEDHSLTTQSAVINISHSPQQGNAKEQPVKQKSPSHRSVIIKKKNVTNQMAESAMTSGMNVIENQSATTSTRTEHVEKIKVVKQVQTITEHKTAREKHDLKFRNLNMGQRGLITLDKKKLKPDLASPLSPSPLSDSEFPLPPPPPPLIESENPTHTQLVMRQDSDLPPPPPPPPPLAVESTSEPDPFPPPPPPPAPPAAAHDCLPPPPPEQELCSLASPPPPLSPPKNKKMPVFSARKVQSGISLPKLLQEEERPRPPRKVFVPPVKLPSPPIEPQPIKLKPYARKFKTPLMLAEERYRKQREESDINKGVFTVSSPPIPESFKTKVVSEVNTTKAAMKEETKNRITSEVIQEETAKTATEPTPEITISSSFSNIATPHSLASKPIIPTRNEKSVESFSNKQHLSSNLNSARHIVSISSKQLQMVSGEQSVSAVSSFTEDDEQTNSAELSDAEISKKQSEKNVSSGLIQDKLQKVATKPKSIAHGSSMHSVPSHIPLRKPLISTVNLNLAENSSNKPVIISDQNSLNTSATRHISSVSSMRQETISSREELMSSVSSSQSHTCVHREERSSSSVAVATSEHHENIEKFSSDDGTKMDIAKDDMNLQAIPPLKNDSPRKTESPIMPGKGKAPFQATRRLKVTPTFKIKASKMQTVKNTDEKDMSRELSTENEVSLPNTQLMSENMGGSVSQADSIEVPQENTRKTPNSVEKHTETELKAEIVQEEKQKEESSVSKEDKVETPAKKLKRKSKKEKEIRHQTHDGLSKEAVPPGSEKTTQQEQISTAQTIAIKKEHILVKDEITITESSSAQSFQQHASTQIQKHTKSSKKPKSQTTEQNIQEKIKDKKEASPPKLTVDQAEDTVAAHPAAAMVEASQRRKEVKKLLSLIKEIQSASEKPTPSSVKRMLNNAPDWLIGSEEKQDLEVLAVEHNVPRLKEIITYLRNLAQAKLLYLDENIAVIEKSENEFENAGAAKPAVSKTSSGSGKRKKKKPTLQGEKTPEPITPSPSLELSSTSSTVTSCGPIMTDSPSCKSDEPTSQDKDVSLPTICKSDETVKTTDISVRSPQEESYPPLPPQHTMVAENISEIANFPQMIHAETDESEKPVATGSVKHKKEFFEEAQKAEVNKMYIRKDPIDIPERLGAEIEELKPDGQQKEFDEPPWVDLLGLVNKFESSIQSPAKESTRKDPIDIPERLGPDSEESETENKTDKGEEELPKVDLVGLVHKFQSPTEMSEASRTEDHKDSIDIPGQLGISDFNIVSSHKEHEEVPRVDLLELVNKFESPAQMSDVTKSFSWNDPIDSLVQLGLDMESFAKEKKMEKEPDELPRVDLLGLVNKFESPEQKVYVRKEPITIPERLGSDTEDAEMEKISTEIEEIPAYDIKTIKTFFEEADQSVHVKEQKIKHEKQDFEEGEIMKDSSEQINILSQQRGSQLCSPPPVQKEITPGDPVEPVGFSEAKSVTEHFSSVDELGNKISGLRSVTTVSQHSESVRKWQGAPSYADIVKRKISECEDSAITSHEEKESQKFCMESESVLTSVKCSSSEERTSQTVSREEGTVISESSSTGVRTVQGMSEESLSDGIGDRRQTEFP